jgi:hypothetical protein
VQYIPIVEEFHDSGKNRRPIFQNKTFGDFLNQCMADISLLFEGESTLFIGILLNGKLSPRKEKKKNLQR